jgi:hypothetical protein
MALSHRLGAARLLEAAANAFFGSKWVDYLEQDVVDAIAPYERKS